jgi:Domain of unknown function (DUF4279)
MNNRISASFSIWSKELRSDKVSEVLDFTPDNFTIKGIEHSPPRSRPTSYGWHIHNKEFDQILAGEVLDRLVKKMRPFVEKIPRLLEIDPNIEMNFYLNIAPKNADVVLYIERDTINFMTSLNGCLSMEFFDL